MPDDSPKKSQRLFAHIVNFGLVSVAAFVALLALTAIEWSFLRLAGVKHVPKSTAFTAGFRSFSVSSDGQRGVVLRRIAKKQATHGQFSELELRDFGTGKSHHIDIAKINPTCATISPSGKEIVFSDTNGGIYHTQLDMNRLAGSDASPYRRIHTIYQAGVRDLAVSPNGKSVVVVTTDVTMLIHTQQEEVLWSTAHDAPDDSHLITFSPDSDYLLVYSGGNKTYVLDVLTGRNIAALALPSVPLTAFAFDANAQAVKLHFGNGTLETRKAATDELIEAIVLPNYYHVGGPPVFSPDGRCLAVADRSIIRIYDTSTGNLLGRIVGHEKGITGIAVKSRHEIYSCDLAGIVRKWQSGHTRVTKSRSVAEITSSNDNATLQNRLAVVEFASTQ